MVDHVWEALRQMAGNPAATPEVLRRLANFTDTGVTSALRLRRDLPPDVVLTLAAQCLTPDRAAIVVLRHDERPSVAEELETSTDSVVRAGLTTAKRVRREMELMSTAAGLRVLLSDPDPQVRLKVRRAIAGNAGVPVDRLERLADDDVPDVRAVVLMHPATPHDLRCASTRPWTSGAGEPTSRTSTDRDLWARTHGSPHLPVDATLHQQVRRSAIGLAACGLILSTAP